MQPTIFDIQPLFDGDTFDPEKDQARLTGLLDRVFWLMLDGRWRTLSDIHAKVGGSEASISARLRDLRKQKFGAFLVERRRLSGGLWEYRLCL